MSEIEVARFMSSLWDVAEQWSIGKRGKRRRT